MNRFQKVFFSLGSSGYIVLLRALMVWIVIFYADPENGNFFTTLSFIGLALFISQIADALVDPFIGYYVPRLGLSKRTLLLIVSIPFALCFVAAFNPISSTPSVTNEVFIILVLVGFRVFYSIYQIVYLSLIPDLAKSEDQRRQLSAWVGFGTLIGAGVVMVAGGALVEFYGYQNSILIFAGIALAFLFTPCFLNVRGDEGFSSQTPKDGIISSYVRTLRIPGFIWVLFAFLATNMAYTTISIVAPFVSKAVIKETNLWTSYLLGGAFCFAMLAFPYVPRAIAQFGAKKMMVFALASFSITLLGIGSVCAFSTGTLQKTILFALFCFSGVALAFSLTLVNVFISRFADQAPSTLLYAAYGALLRLEAGLATLFITLLLQEFGASAENSAGIPLSTALAGGVILTACLLFSRKFTLPEPQQTSASS